PRHHVDEVRPRERHEHEREPVRGAIGAGHEVAPPGADTARGPAQRIEDLLLGDGVRQTHHHGRDEQELDEHRRQRAPQAAEYPRMANLAQLYDRRCGTAIAPPMEVMLTMRRTDDCRRWGSAASVTCTAPQKFTAIAFWKSFSDIDW